MQSADKLIYNRFDYIFPDSIRILKESEGEKYEFALHIDDNKAYLNVWGRDIPQQLFIDTVRTIFSCFLNVDCISVIRSKNDYYGQLFIDDDYVLNLPSTYDELLERLKAKHRYNIRRMERLLCENVGNLSVHTYLENIPDEIVELYFAWKEKSHAHDYGMSAKEYLKKYYVNGAILLCAGEKKIGTAFFCRYDNVAYFENFSFEQEMRAYSAGFLTYLYMLRTLIENGCKTLYLGGGDYFYKGTFNSIHMTSYTGKIYRKEIFERINSYFEKEKINNVAIYGLGKKGREAIQFWKNLDSVIKYGIDKNEKVIEYLVTYKTGQKLPYADAVIITMQSRIPEVENMLIKNFKKVIYFDDLVRGEI